LNGTSVAARGTTGPVRENHQIFYSERERGSRSRPRSASPSGGAAEDCSHVLPDAAQLAAHGDLGDAVDQREQAVEQREGKRADARAAEQDHAERDGHPTAEAEVDLNMSGVPSYRTLNCSQRIWPAGIPSFRKPLESAVIMAGGPHM
jgi:hypothetical protein